MIDGYLRQGYTFCNFQGKKKNEKNVIVVIIIPHKCFDHTGVSAWRSHWIKLKTKRQGEESTRRIIRFHYKFNKIEKQILERTSTDCGKRTR